MPGLLPSDKRWRRKDEAKFPVSNRFPRYTVRRWMEYDTSMPERNTVKVRYLPDGGFLKDGKPAGRILCFAWICRDQKMAFPRCAG